MSPNPTLRKAGLERSIFRIRARLADVSMQRLLSELNAAQRSKMTAGCCVERDIPL